MKAWLIRYLGGYPSIDDAIDAIRDNEDGVARRRILTLAVRRLYNTISAADILQLDKTSGQITYMGKQIGKEEFGVIAEEAKAFFGSRLWKVLQADLKWQANKKMYIESTDVMQMEAAKLFSYAIDVIHTRLKALSIS